jgi:hypothetical protein
MFHKPKSTVSERIGRRNDRHIRFRNRRADRFTGFVDAVAGLRYALKVRRIDTLILGKPHYTLLSAVIQAKSAAGSELSTPLPVLRPGSAVISGPTGPEPHPAQIGPHPVNVHRPDAASRKSGVMSHKKGNRRIYSVLPCGIGKR